jgi:DNA invertase Pin-like site-specific DNA recombinase
MVPNHLFARRAELNFTSTWVYLALARHAYGTGTCFLLQRTIADELGHISERAVRRALAELEALGLIVITQRGKRQANEYTLLPVTGTPASAHIAVTGTKRASVTGTPVSGPIRRRVLKKKEAKKKLTRPAEPSPSAKVQQKAAAPTGRRNDRPALDEALRLCRLHRATLLVAKLDRLARNAEFLRRILRESGERGVVFCDMPNIPEGPTGKFLIGMMAEVAELEAGMISQRTKAALAVVKKTKQLGGLRSSEHDARWKEIADASRPLAWQARRARTRAARAEILPEIEKLKAAGRTTLRAIAEGLNTQGVSTPKGGQWSPTQVQRVLHSSVSST